MFKTVKFIGLSVLIMTFLPIAVAEASTDERIQYETSPNSIEINWDVNSDYVKLYEGSKEIDAEVDNDRNSAAINQLEQDTLYNITIVYYDHNDEIIDFDYLKISTDSNKANLSSSQSESEVEDVDMDSMYVDDGVKIEWEGEIPNEGDNYTILRNGKEIGETDSQSFVDESAEKGEKYTYEVSTKEKVSEKVLDERLQAAEENDIEVTPELEKEISYDYYSVNSYIRTPEKTLKGHLSDLETLVRWGIQYTTFIADDKVDKPFLPLLGGDDRGFDPFNDNYRTRTAIMADFTDDSIEPDNNMPGINSKGIDVGETIVYDNDGKVKKRDTQDDYTMDFSNYGFTDGTANWEVDHSVGIPIKIAGISPPDIDYQYTVSLSADSTKSASGSISGSHDRAPHHEIALYIPQSDVSETIYRSANEGFLHLLPEPMQPNRDFSIRI